MPDVRKTPVSVLLDAIVETDYGQFDLTWDGGEGINGDWDRVFAGHVNGLAGAASGDGLYLNLARRSGGSPVRIELLDGEPAVPDGWGDIVEVSIAVPDAPVRWETWAGESSGDPTVPAGTAAFASMPTVETLSTPASLPSGLSIATC